MMKTRSRFPITPSGARWLVTGLVMAAVLVGSLVPGGTIPISVNIEPHFKHLIAFALLGFLLVLALEANWRQAATVALALGVLGFLIEVAQLFIPDRLFLWIDVAAGFFGALMGAVFGVFLRWFVR